MEFHEGIFGGEPFVGGGSARTVAAAGDGGADEFAGDDFGVELIEIGEEIVGPVGMDVAGEDDGVLDFGAGKKFEDATAIDFVAGPLVHAETLASALFLIDAGHHDLLSEDVPRLARAAEPFEKPLALRGAKDGGVWIKAIG